MHFELQNISFNTNLIIPFCNSYVLLIFIRVHHQTDAWRVYFFQTYNNRKFIGFHISCLCENLGMLRENCQQIVNKLGSSSNMRLLF
jgi:hypothetical protein